MIKQDLEKLNTNDIYSLILFAIFQLNKSPEYAVLSELIYAVDRDSLLNMCKQFGGMSIRIPTLEELNIVLEALLLYCSVNLDGNSLEDSMSAISDDKQEEILNVYDTIIGVISDYDFRRN